MIISTDIKKYSQNIEVLDFIFGTIREKNLLSYDDLAIFIAVVERGSLIAAAKKTNIPSSTLSRRLSRLEADLKIKLLERNSRKIHLTEKGKIFFEQCSPLIHQLKENTKSLSESIDKIHGKLKITAPTYMGNTLMADLILDFMKLNPEINLEMVLSNGIEDIIDEEIDIAIRIGPLEDSTFIAQHLWDIEYALCASPDYLAKHGTPSVPEDIKNHQAIILNTQPYPWRFRLLNKQTDTYVSPLNRLVLNDFKLAIHAASNGIGIICLPRSFAQEKFKSRELIQLMPQYELLNRRTAYAVYPERRYLPKKTQLFIAYLKEKSTLLHTE